MEKFDWFENGFEDGMLFDTDFMDLEEDLFPFELSIDNLSSNYGLMNKYLKEDPNMKYTVAYILANRAKIERTIERTCRKYGMPYEEFYFAEFLYNHQVVWNDFDKEYFVKRGCFKFDAEGKVKYPKLEQYVFARLKYFMKAKRNEFYKDKKFFVSIDGLTSSRDEDDGVMGTIPEDRLVYEGPDDFKKVELLDSIKCLVKILRKITKKYGIDIIKYLILLSSKKNTDKEIAKALNVSVSKVRAFQKVFLKGIGPEEEVMRLRSYVVALLKLLIEAQMSLYDCLFME